MTDGTDIQGSQGPDDFLEGVAVADPTDQTPEESALDKKINQHFAGVVVRKDLVKAVKGNAIVPSYVMEYLLGQYAASDDEATIHAGIGSVREILAKHYVHRNQSELVKSTIRERGRYKIIDKVTVLQRIRYLPVIERGKHLDLSFVDASLARSIRVSSSTVLHAHLDGELMSARRFEIDVPPARFLFRYEMQ